jgi:GT2 family glycosyltransferase
MSGRRKIVVLGMMSVHPVGGVVWQTVHYVVGLRRLGFDAYYVEASGHQPSYLLGEDKNGHRGRRAADFVERTMGRFGLARRWAFHALAEDGHCYGLSERELRRLYREAEIIINLHGATVPRPEHYETGRLIYLETDPVVVQLEVHRDDQEAIAYLEPHCAFFTFAEQIGRPDCKLPISDRFEFRPTRQPVVLDFWTGHGAERPTESFTTVGNWRQLWRDVTHGNDTYTWSKHHEFLKVIDLPSRTQHPFELALSQYDEEARRLLGGKGWSVRDALEISRDTGSYRAYVAGSRAEFTVAKDQNVRLRTGWFSDRSATYLAAGRPVVTQDTGFGTVLPTGEGLFAFQALDDAVAAVEAINAGYERHRAAAAQIGEEYFDHRVVLGRLLDDIGVQRIRRSSLIPTSKRPTVLPAETIDAIMWRRVPNLASPAAGEPVASVVVVAFDGLVFTRLCLESVLAHTRGEYEVIVVDNASSDDTPDYLRHLAERNPRVRIISNERNVGFAAANNQGLDAAKGEVLVLLNNDTVVAPGWLERLAARSADARVGAVGPVTNRSNTESQIETSYRSYGEMLEFAEARAREHDGQVREVGMLTMFCVALRRDVLDRVGLLDTRFGIGTLEDDDYAMRLRAAGYRLVCAEDVFVHHFGEASFGKLVATGEYQRLLEENKARFEEKWGIPWEPYDRRPDPAYEALLDRVRDEIDAAIPAGATVLVTSRGDDALLRLRGRRAWHFPQADGGEYAGHHPGDSAEAIAHLEDLRSKGAEFLVVPSTSDWWLEFYDDFATHLESRYSALRVDEACSIFDLRTSRLAPEAVA